MRDKLQYLAVLIAVILGTLFLQLNKIEPFESFSLRFNDVNFELQDKEPNKDIVFVAIDEPSVNRFGRWPWNREILAKGIDSLTQADIVLMDMIFSEPTSFKADDRLADAISKLNVSVCGFFLRHNATQVADEEAVELLSDSSLDLLHSHIFQYSNPKFISAPFAEINTFKILQSCSMSGSFSTLAHSDKLFRSYPIAVYYDDILFPSLGVQGVRLKFNSDVKRVSKNVVELNKHKIYIDDKGFVRLNFYKREQYKIVSFLDVVDHKIKPEYFKGKIVLLGITEVGSGDVVSTPIGFLYGPLLHYTFISNFLENHLIIEMKYISSITMILLTFIPFILVFYVKKILHRTILNIVIYMSAYMIVRALFIYKMIYIDLFFPLFAISLSAVAIEALAFSIHEKSSRFLKDAFSSYLSEDLLQELTKNPKALELGGEKKKLSILFSDIRGFTSISEALDPVDLINLLNRYFTPMTNTVLKHNGMLDKYIGDALMAFYNAPVDVKNHADEACLTALEMIEHLNELNQELKNEDIVPLDIGIGINTASVVVGNMGSDSRFNYTAMGDGVNLASRLESLTKVYGVKILITEFTVKKLTKEFIYRKLESVVVKGKEEAVLIYELMQNSKDSHHKKELYDEALEIYIGGDFKKAELLFTKLVDIYNDGVSRYFLQNIEKKISWGIHTMVVK